MFNEFYFNRHIVTKGRNGENWAFLNLSCSYKNVETHLNLWELTPRILLFEITIKINTLWRHLIRENRENKACSLIRTYGMNGLKFYHLAIKMKFEPFRAYLQQCCNPTLLVFVVVIVVLISQSQLKIAFNCVQDSPEREKMNISIKALAV